MLKSRFTKSLLIIGLLLSQATSLWGQQPSTLEGYTTDPSHALTTTTKQQLNSQAQQLDHDTSVQIATVIIPELQGQPIEDMAQTIFAKWKIGKKGEDNGLLLLISLKERQIRIHTGYGLEGDIPDSKAAQLIKQYFVPAAKAGQLDTAILSIQTALIQHISQTHIPGSQPKKTVKKRQQIPDTLQFFLLIMLILFLFKGRGWLLPLLIGSAFMSGGGSGRNSDDNSFGGFGGGDSGGGGSSGSW